MLLYIYVYIERDETCMVCKVSFKYTNKIWKEITWLHIYDQCIINPIFTHVTQTTNINIYETCSVDDVLLNMHGHYTF